MKCSLVVLEYRMNWTDHGGVEVSWYTDTLAPARGARTPEIR
jgi:hypothetical protein